MNDASSPARTRPSAFWFALCPIFILIGIGFGVRAGFTEAERISDTMEMLGADGAGTVELEAGEEPTVWAVWEDGRDTEGLSRPRATVTVTDPGGQPVRFRRSDGGSRSTYQSGSSTGIDVGKFTADRAGSYDVAVTYDAVEGAGAVPLAAVGDLDILGTVLRVLKPVALGFAAAIAWLILLLVARHRSKGRHARAADPTRYNLPPGPPQLPGNPPSSPSSSSNQGPITFN